MRTLSFEEFVREFSEDLPSEKMNFSPRIALKLDPILPELYLEFGGDLPTIVLITNPEDPANKKKIDFDLAIDSRHFSDFLLSAQTMSRFSEEIGGNVGEAVKIAGLKMASTVYFIRLDGERVKIRLSAGKFFEAYAVCHITELDSFLKLN